MLLTHPDTPEREEEDESGDILQIFPLFRPSNDSSWLYVGKSECLGGLKMQQRKPNQQKAS